jgi:hypothetical protein
MRICGKQMKLSALPLAVALQCSNRYAVSTLFVFSTKQYNRKKGMHKQLQIVCVKALLQMCSTAFKTLPMLLTAVPFYEGTCYILDLHILMLLLFVPICTTAAATTAITKRRTVIES